jgi:hypothetical protein
MVIIEREHNGCVNIIILCRHEFFSIWRQVFASKTHTSGEKNVTGGKRSLPACHISRRLGVRHPRESDFNCQNHEVRIKASHTRAKRRTRAWGFGLGLNPFWSSRPHPTHVDVNRKI